jgi:hypothetical protein
MSNDFDTIDYEEITTKEDAGSDRPDDFMSVIVDKIYNFDWIILLAVALAFLFVISDIYNEAVVSRFKGAIGPDGNPTTYGYLIQDASLLIAAVIGRILFALGGL